MGGEAWGEPDAAFYHTAAELHGVRARSSPKVRAPAIPRSFILALSGHPESGSALWRHGKDACRSLTCVGEQDGNPLGLMLALAEVGARGGRILPQAGRVRAQLPVPHAHRHRFHLRGWGPGFPDFREVGHPPSVKKKMEVKCIALLPGT